MSYESLLTLTTWVTHCYDPVPYLVHQTSGISLITSRRQSKSHRAKSLRCPPLPSPFLMRLDFLQRFPLIVSASYTKCWFNFIFYLCAVLNFDFKKYILPFVTVITNKDLQTSILVDNALPLTLICNSIALFSYSPTCKPNLGSTFSTYHTAFRC